METYGFYYSIIHETYLANGYEQRLNYIKKPSFVLFESATA